MKILNWLALITSIAAIVLLAHITATNTVIHGKELTVLMFFAYVMGMWVAGFMEKD